MDQVRADIDLIQTELDACRRELQAARERVNVQIRFRAVSAELADIDRALEEQDRWLDSTSAVETYDEDRLKGLRAECQASISISDHIHFTHTCVIFHSICNSVEISYIKFSYLQAQFSLQT